MLRQFCKHSAQGLAIVLVLPCVVAHWLLARCGQADVSLAFFSQLLACLPGKSGSYLRVGFYRTALKHCDPSANISYGVLFSKVGAELHRNVYVGPNCHLGLVTLEEDVLLGPAVHIPSGPDTHGIASLEIPIREQPGRSLRVVIGRDSWVGAASIVLADLPPQTVVGAGSVVTKSPPPKTIIVGNPARVLRHRETA